MNEDTNEKMSIPIADVNEYIDIYRSANTLLSSDYINHDTYNKIIDSLCFSMIGRMALFSQKVKEKEAAK